MSRALRILAVGVATGIVGSLLLGLSVDLSVGDARLDRVEDRLERLEHPTTSSVVVRSQSNPPTGRRACSVACVGVRRDGHCAYMDPASAAERGLDADPECAK